MRTLVWFRGKDLRAADRAPLREAAASGEVIPLFVVDPYFFAPAPPRELPHPMQFPIESRASRLLTIEGESAGVTSRGVREPLSVTRRRRPRTA